MARTVLRQRPQCEPAPQAAATCRDVSAPLATSPATASLVVPVHRHTIIALHLEEIVALAIIDPTQVRLT